MWIILDIIVVLIVALYVYISAKKGFVRTVIELVGFFLAVYISFTASGLIAEGIFASFLEPSVSEVIEETIIASAGENSAEMAEDIWENIPDAFTTAAESFGVDKQMIHNLIQNSTSSADTKSIAEIITLNTVRPIAVPIIKTICGLIIFSVLMILVKILARLLGRAVNIPIVGKLNKLLGGTLGALKGVLVAYVLVVLITLIMGFTEEGFLIFTKENVEESGLFKILAEHTPL